MWTRAKQFFKEKLQEITPFSAIFLEFLIISLQFHFYAIKISQCSLFFFSRLKKPELFQQKTIELFLFQSREKVIFLLISAPHVPHFRIYTFGKFTQMQFMQCMQCTVKSNHYPFAFLLVNLAQPCTNNMLTNTFCVNVMVLC